MVLKEAKEIVEANEAGKADNEVAYEKALAIIAEAKEVEEEVKEDTVEEEVKEDTVEEEVKEES